MRTEHVWMVGLILLVAASGRAADPALPGSGPEEKVAASEIWPASLERIQGRYLFVQVASPGGLWRSGDGEGRQVSLHELSPEARQRLEKAEIVIADLRLPTRKDASRRLSPSKRGYLRHYEEQAPGRLVLKGLPGIGGGQGDSGAYSGPVEFGILHSSHSNPSVSGVMTLRRQQEQIWGAAIFDYADLTATPPLPAGAKPDEEPIDAVGNARILRSGLEIFAYVHWEEPGANGATRTFRGCVRLAREDQFPKTAPPPLKPRETEVASAR